MPAVRTASAPTRVPKMTAITTATGTASHQGQFRLTFATALDPRIAVP